MTLDTLPIPDRNVSSRRAQSDHLRMHQLSLRFVYHFCLIGDIFG
jgi:hypothetical protein